MEITNSEWQQALKIVIDEHTASSSLLQRKMKIGYGKASTLMDLLEFKEVIGSKDEDNGATVLASSIDKAPTSLSGADFQGAKDMSAKKAEETRQKRSLEKEQQYKMKAASQSIFLTRRHNPGYYLVIALLAVIILLLLFR